MVPRIAKMTQVLGSFVVMPDGDTGAIFVDEGENVFYFSSKKLKLIRLDTGDGYTVFHGTQNA